MVFAGVLPVDPLWSVGQREGLAVPRLLGLGSGRLSGSGDLRRCHGQGRRGHGGTVDVSRSKMRNG